MWVVSDPSGTLQVRMTHIKWFTILTPHVYLKLLVAIPFTHAKFFCL